MREKHLVNGDFSPSATLPVGLCLEERIGTVALGKGWLPCQRFWPTLAILHFCTQAPDSGWVPILSSDSWCRRHLSPKAAHIY